MLKGSELFHRPPTDNDPKPYLVLDQANSATGKSPMRLYYPGPTDPPYCISDHPSISLKSALPMIMQLMYDTVETRYKPIFVLDPSWDDFTRKFAYEYNRSMNVLQRPPR